MHDIRRSSRCGKRTVREVHPDFQAGMAMFLDGGTEVVVYRQREVPAVGDFAIAVASTDFCIECCESPQAAKAVAQGLRLGVTTRTRVMSRPPMNIGNGTREIRRHQFVPSRPL